MMPIDRRASHHTNPFRVIFLGVIIGAIVSCTPLILSEFSTNISFLPIQYSPLVAIILTVFLFILFSLYRILSRLYVSFKEREFSVAYFFLVPSFLHIFFAGFNLDVTNYILISYLLTLIVLLFLRKINTIIITPLLYFIIVHFVICNMTLLLPHGTGMVMAFNSLLMLNIKFILVLMILNALATEKELDNWFKLYIIMCIFVSLIAIGQCVIFYITGINYSLAPPEIIRVVSTPIGSYPRVGALFQHPSVMATDIAPMFMMLIYGFMSPEYLNRSKRMILLVPLGLMAITLFLSTTRGVWVAIFFGMVGIFFMKKPNLLPHKLAIITLLFVLSYVTGMLDFVYGLLVELNESSVSAREELFTLGLVAIQEHPVTGYGLYNFVGYTGNFWNLSVHSSPFQIWSETGILGLVSYYSIVAYLIWRTVRQLRRTTLGGNRLILEAYLIALITLMISNGFQQITWATFTFFFFALGECIARIVKASEESGREMRLMEF
jgi:O-antigen ligase